MLCVYCLSNALCIGEKYRSSEQPPHTIGLTACTPLAWRLLVCAANGYLGVVFGSVLLSSERDKSRPHLRDWTVLPYAQNPYILPRFAEAHYGNISAVCPTRMRAFGFAFTNHAYTLPEESHAGTFTPRVQTFEMSGLIAKTRRSL